MNLIIEQGNSALKAAVIDGDAIVRRLTIEQQQETVEQIERLIVSFKPVQGIMSSVSGRDERLLELLNNSLQRFLWLDSDTRLPLRICYRTPTSLGKDRIAAAVGAFTLRPNSNLLVIDAGTAITYDIVEADGIFTGGNISPGMTTRFRSLNLFTQQLPLITEPQDDVMLTGDSTETAIQAGVVNGIVFEMDGFIDALKAKYNDIYVFLTGGHSFYFDKRLKNHTFADLNLVIKGLNRILEYNANGYK
jgi:type III pantothenate kinase